jgi:hypothetical protein
MKIFTKRNAIIGGGALAATGITVFAVKKIRARKARNAANGTPTGITVTAPAKRGIWPFRKEVAAPMPTEA